jgi:dTDP-L-rhamnose 4-epimerase
MFLPGEPGKGGPYYAIRKTRYGRLRFPIPTITEACWMAERVLITGGAGFIGRRLTDALLEAGKDVRVLDAMIGQVHSRPVSIRPEVELLVGDVQDAAMVGRALDGVDKIVHLAAEVGVGQSMYDVTRYVGANDLGTAVLLEQAIKRPIARIVVASSMSIYGEGLYRTASGAVVQDAERRPGAKGWDICDAEGRPLQPLPTPEWKRPALASVYALTKYVQERMTLTLAAAYGIESVALRLFNVFGPGQALDNPYTGVLAIFAARLLNGRSPVIFEDGQQRRDFVHVDDVARAFVLALDRPGISGGVFNVGSGRDVSIADVAIEIARAMGRPDIPPEISGKARAGDIRNCFADVTAAREQLGFEAKVIFPDGLDRLAAWLEGQSASDRTHDANRELEVRGLVA